MRAKTVYRNIQQWYVAFLVSAAGRRVIRTFDSRVEEHDKITGLKKVDFVLWQTRKQGSAGVLVGEPLAW